MSFIFDIQTFATTYTTTAQTQTTATPINSETQVTPTVIVLSDKTLVDKEHAEYWTRKLIDYNKKHFLTVDNLVTNKEIDDFFDKLEEEAAAEANTSEDDLSGDSTEEPETPESGNDNP